MCGIGGYIAKKTSFDGSSYLSYCSDLMSERGPDQEGFHSDRNVGLVHRRLSIIDLSESAKQPMFDESGAISIVFNGEIYNFKELKEELLKQGAHFRTSSDTEVILEGYKRWGLPKLLSRLDGMFAFALFDKKSNKLFLARDIFGKKPLYYYEDDTCILFSSDIRAIHQQVKSKLNLDFDSLDFYLSELSTPQPKTIWKEVRQLKPSSFFDISLSDFSISEHSYFQLPTLVSNSITLEDAIGETEALLKKAILKRMVADVPVGCFLSGGVDSGLIVSLLAANIPDKVKTFSVGFDGENNELPDARLVAERYHTDHHEIIITPKIIDDLPKLIQYVGEPFADSSLLPSYYVCKAMQGKLKVVLSGDGGDELFGGYPQYMHAFKADQFFEKYPGKTSAYLIAQADKLIARLQGRKENAGAYWHYTHLDGAARLSRQIGFTEKEKKLLYLNTGAHLTSSFYSKYMNLLWQQNTTNSFAATLMKSSLNTRLLNDYLVKVDRASMINSLEVRSPFLDKELAQFAFTLPDNYKFYNKETKFILKKLASHYFDPKIFLKPKRGFSFPLNKWLQIGFRERINSLKDQSAPIYKTGLFSNKTITTYVNAYNSGDLTMVGKVWLLLCLDEWCDYFL